jgi:hypothetical protein
VITFLLNHTEYVALTVNILTFLAFLVKGETGKAVYWAGTILIVLGLLKMKG